MNRFTLRERTTIQSLLNRGIPIAVIVYILMQNREGGRGRWGRIRSAVLALMLIDQLRGDAITTFMGNNEGYYPDWMGGGPSILAMPGFLSDGG